MSLYAEHIKETRGFETVEDELGFATYLISGEECYIETVHVSPGARRTGLATKFADEIKSVAKMRGCKFLSTTINVKFSEPLPSLIAQATYGFKIVAAQNDVIFLKMEI